jgi:hypothetical protein
MVMAPPLLIIEPGSVAIKAPPWIAKLDPPKFMVLPGSDVIITSPPLPSLVALMP